MKVIKVSASAKVYSFIFDNYLLNQGWQTKARGPNATFIAKICDPLGTFYLKIYFFKIKKSSSCLFFFLNFSTLRKTLTTTINLVLIS